LKKSKISADKRKVKATRILGWQEWKGSGLSGRSLLGEKRERLKRGVRPSRLARLNNAKDFGGGRRKLRRVRKSGEDKLG